MRQKHVASIGQRFGLLAVVECLRQSSDGRKSYSCKCDCGNTTTVLERYLLSGHTRSCGCLRAAANATRGTHKATSSPEYISWCAMKARCYNTKNNRYRIYGGRGIKVCPEWKNSFETFLKDMGKRPTPNHSLDRIDSNGDYEPRNCRWATDLEQIKNQQRTLKITFKGATRTLVEWSVVLGVTRRCLYNRIALKHWPLEKALVSKTYKPFEALHSL